MNPFLIGLVPQPVKKSKPQVAKAANPRLANLLWTPSEALENSQRVRSRHARNAVVHCPEQLQLLAKIKKARRDRMRNMRAEGMTWEAIARVMSCTESFVRREVKR